MANSFMECWGNFFTNAAKEQRFPEIADWARVFSRFMDWAALVPKSCALESLTPPGIQFMKEWNTFGKELNKSFLAAVFEFWGIKADPERYLELVKKYEELKEKIASQEETIKHLRLLLDEARNATPSPGRRTP